MSNSLTPAAALEANKLAISPGNARKQPIKSVGGPWDRRRQGKRTEEKKRISRPSWNVFVLCDPSPRPLAFFCARPTRTALLGPPSVGSFLIPHAKGQGCVLDYCNKQSEGTVMTGGQSVALSNRSDYTTLLFYGIVELAPYNRKTIRINHHPSSTTRQQHLMCT